MAREATNKQERQLSNGRHSPKLHPNDELGSEHDQTMTGMNSNEENKDDGHALLLDPRDNKSERSQILSKQSSTVSQLKECRICF